ncbi:unnamed protein product [Pieris macdunnoughi]|uniref:FLYWCH-type domain-containing protein n=1 Tax=Pieris macdunnoughi TaxID=345717 RepID=A0A821QA03_9NEOP|nr:unnamed protein product [Pieris macdunnoughi]
MRFTTSRYGQPVLEMGYLPSEYELVPRGASYVLRLGKHTFSTNYANAAGMSIWYCSKRRRQKCKVRIRMINSDILDIQGLHTHN